MGLYRKKPIVIEAIRFTGENRVEVNAFMGRETFKPEVKVIGFMIDTLEGVMEAKIGDWIIKGIQGEFYPCKSDIFDATYEVV
jgi:hypothetical protein